LVDAGIEVTIRQPVFAHYQGWMVGPVTGMPWQQSADIHGNLLKGACIDRPKLIIFA
jgi:hypothetical protein